MKRIKKSFKPFKNKSLKSEIFFDFKKFHEKFKEANTKLKN